jgi:hypothetical protein
MTRFNLRGRSLIDHVTDRVTTSGAVRVGVLKGTHRPRTTSLRLPTRSVDQVQQRTTRGGLFSGWASSPETAPQQNAQF